MSPQASNMEKRPDCYGQILTPKSGRRQPTAPIWCADSGVFTGMFDWQIYREWLTHMAQWRESCAFVTVPDVVGDAVATLDRFRFYAWRVKALGLPVALVAQDGLESLRWPPEYDALFIGGSTAWKLSDTAGWCIRKAKATGKWTHIGRVNSIKRIQHCQLLGVDSADGTSLAFSPDRHYKRFTKQLAQPVLFILEATQ